MSTRTLVANFEVTGQQEIYWGKCDDSDPEWDYPDGDWADECLYLRCEFDFYGGQPEIRATHHNPGEPAEAPSVMVSTWTLTHGDLVVSLSEEGLKLMGLDPKDLEAELVQWECEAGQDDMAEEAYYQKYGNH